MHEPVSARLPEPFCYYREILKSDHLHFGLWREDGPNLSMEEAQQAMFEYLLSFFPPPPAEVLDVGCGLGLSAGLLSRRGYMVTAIAPSPEMIQYARQTYAESGAEFRELGFLDEDDVVFSEGRYDVLLFQESAQYISPLDDLMKKARRLLRADGVLLIGDETCYDKSIKAETAVHLSGDFEMALAENGFRITGNKRIGKEIFPTYDFVIGELTKNRDRIAAACEGKTVAGLDFFIDGWNRQKTWNLQGKTGYEIFVARKDSFSIRPYSPGDEGKILPSFNKVFGTQRTIGHWSWKFRDDPYGSYKISEAFSGEGKLVAHYAGYPVPFYCDTGGLPGTFLSMQIGDTMTLPEVRHVGRGKTSILSRTARHFYAKFCEGMPFTYGFNTGTIKRFGERFLGYQYIDPVPYRVKKVDASSLLRYPLFRKILSRYHVRVIDSFDRGFDSLFERTAPAYRFLVKRESRYLTWRYRNCPDKDYRMLSVHDRMGRLVGWSVFLAKGETLIWGDALFDREYPDAVGHLLSYVSGASFFRGIERIEAWFSRNPAWWDRILDGLGFGLTTEPNNLFPCFYILTGNDVRSELGSNLYYTMGDSDLF